MVNGLKATPGVTKAALIFWLQGRMRDAVNNDEWQKLDRYQAFFSCLSADEGEDGCHRLGHLTEETATVTLAPDDECSAESWLGYWDGSYNDTHFQTGSGNSVSEKYNFHPDPQRGLHTIEGTVRTVGELCIVEGTWTQEDDDTGHFVKNESRAQADHSESALSVASQS